MSAPVDVAGRAPSSPPAPSRRDGVRADIQGMRAVAVGAVVLFHAWPRLVPGGYVGVDVFFVISGFLISSHLLSKPPAEPREFAQFWARRIRRLLPASLLVIAVTLMLSRVFAPSVQWAANAHDGVASAFYVQNWSLAAQAVDYLAADAAATPFQHFWSLSVEEQFYLVWPLLVALPVALGLRWRRPGRGLVGLVFGAVFAVSLWASVELTASEPARAYFVTWTRAWEFAAGALVALVAASAAHRRATRTSDVLAWVGLLAIAVACFGFSSATRFPGIAALLPVAGAALVLAAQSEGARGPGFLWRIPGAQWLGDVSYSVYLWHWPLLLLTPSIIDTALTWPVKVVVLAVALALSGVTKVFVEDRYRRPPPGSPLRTPFLAAGTGMALVAMLGGLQLVEVRWDKSRQLAELRRAEAGPCFGAAALAPGANCPKTDKLYPGLAAAASDRGPAYGDHCFVSTPYTDRFRCTYGTGKVKVALIGNSHAAHWLPALTKIAKQRDWTITTYLVSVCNVSDAATSLPTPDQVRNCTAYGRWVFDETKGDAYDIVLTSERQSTAVPGYTWAATAERSKLGYATYLRRWSDSGANVVVLKDVVPPGELIGRLPDCLSKHRHSTQDCDWPHAQPTPDDPGDYRWMDPLADAAASLSNARVAVVSVDDLLCPGGTCRSVIGGVVTYFDASHLTATYARTLAPELGRRIDAALEGLAS